jgi:sodium/potassium-transporting ATPase subunit alpha
MIRDCGLCNGSNFDSQNMEISVKDQKIHGNASDAALLRFSEVLLTERIAEDSPKLFNVERLRERFPKVTEVPFSSKYKFMMTVHRLPPNEISGRFLHTQFSF